MRIALCIYNPLPISGGVGTFALELIQLFHKFYPTDQVDIITLNTRSSQLLQKIYSCYFLNTSHKEIISEKKEHLFVNQLGKSTYRKVDLLNLIKTLQTYDVIYLQNDILFLAIFRALSFWQKLPPIIIGFHSPMVYEKKKSLQSYLHNILYTSFVYKLLLASGQKFHVLHEFDKKILSSYFPKKNIMKIHNPFNREHFVKNLRRIKQGNHNKNNRFTAIWVGRLTEQKGVDDLVTLIKTMQKSFSMQWIIVGDGEEKSKIEKLRKSYKNIRLLGQVNRSELPFLYQSADIFISTSKWEGYPYAIVEAQSMGLPIIAYDMHATREIIEPDKTGFLSVSIQEFVSRIHTCIGKNPFKKIDIKRQFIKKMNQGNLAKQYKTLFSV